VSFDFDDPQFTPPSDFWNYLVIGILLACVLYAVIR
jgi:hypothetical protein